jgi:hypothetical protein
MRHAAATTATFEASFKIVIWVITNLTIWKLLTRYFY